MGQDYWYAVERNALDIDWRRGSYDYEEAVKMAQLYDRGNAFPLEMRPQIVVIDESEDYPICIYVIRADEMRDFSIKVNGTV